MSTLAEAKQTLRANFDEGIDCPCCGQFVKRYRRSITGSMAYALIQLYRHHCATRQKWIDFPDVLQGAAARGGDYSKLRHWGLIARRPENRSDGSPRNGRWRITPLGVDWIRSKTTVPKYVWLFDQKRISAPANANNPDLTIQEALGNRFNYFDLMQGLP
jgi:hypothetical protein